MIAKDVVEGLKKKFADVHPLIFQRSLERATSPGELFDILFTLPTDYPLVWDGKWMTTKDLFQAKKFKPENSP